MSLSITKGKNTDKRVPLKCPKMIKNEKTGVETQCNCSFDDEKHKCTEIPPGEYLGDGIELGNRTIGKHYGSFDKHPFYYKYKGSISDTSRNGIEAHHLVSSASIIQEEMYAQLAYMMGYDLNHRNNCVLLPTILEVACFFAVPLHNGGHGATFVYDEDIRKDLKSINTWNIKDINQGEIVAVFPSNYTKDEIARLNYEDSVNKIVSNECSKYLSKDICNGKERLDLATKFIKKMDKLSKVIFKKISLFQWTITSDGYDYAPGGIGCCKQKTLPKKREEIKKVLKDVKLPSADKAKAFMTSLNNNSSALDKLKEKTSFVCGAGHRTNNKNHKVDNASAVHYKERITIEEFDGFKEAHFKIKRQK